MIGALRTLAAAAIVAFAGAAAAQTAPLAPAMAEGNEVKGPKGFYELCARDAKGCPVATTHRGPVVAQLTPAAFAALNALNRQINEQVQPITDADQYGVVDVWNAPGVAAGDCEDYAMTKRAALIARGWPAEALLLGIVKGSDSPFHAILIVRTDRGDFVLDNLSDRVQAWTETGYDWVIRQSATNSAKWVRIAGAVASPAQVAAAQ